MEQKPQTSEAQEIWSILKEVSTEQKKLQKSQKELQKSQKETDKQIKTLSSETDKQIKTLSSETDKQIKTLSSETDKQMKECTKKLEKTREIFETQWGRLIESLVSGKLVELLIARGIEVRSTSPNIKASYTDSDGEKQYKEFDIIVVNGTEIVVVEVKTTLTPDKVKHFIKALTDFKKYLPIYKTYTVYGAVAYLRSESEADLFSERQGLFVIKATGDSASITNNKNFKPKVFSEN